MFPEVDITFVYDLMSLLVPKITQKVYISSFGISILR